MSPAFAADRPNIVLIMCDDMGYEGVSAYGSESYHTPVLDRLAAEGMLFRHCYSQPICTPSRVQIMTGRYNLRNYTNFGVLQPSEITFGNLLKDAGYRTGICGKWQLGGAGDEVRAFGFDTYCLWHVAGKRDSRFWDPVILEDDKWLQDTAGKFGPDIMADFAERFIAKSAVDKDRPFFLYYPMCLVHWPFVPTPDSPEGGSRARSGKYDGQNGGEEYFPDMIAYMDKIVGRIDTALAKAGVRDNTLVLFTGDNGCATNIVSKMGDGVIHGGKGSMPDAGTHVALVASWPDGIREKKTSDALIDFTDMLPTVCDLAGAKLPEDAVLDGKSFLPVLKGETESVREWVFCEYKRNPIWPPKKDADREAKLKQIDQMCKAHTFGRYARTQQYKLYQTGQFYDVSADVLEKADIPPGKGSEAAEAAREQLQAVLDGMPSWRPFGNCNGENVR